MAEKVLGLALLVVEQIAEIAGLRVPGIFLQGLSKPFGVGQQLRLVLFFAQQSGGIGQQTGTADGVGGGHHRGAIGFQTLGVQPLLGRIIVPAAGIVEIVPGAQQSAAQVGGGGAPRLAGIEAIVLHQTGIAVLHQLQRAGAVEQLPKQIELGGHQRAVEDEGGLIVSLGGEIGVEAVVGPAQIGGGKAHADHAGIPGVQAVPPAAGGVVPDVLAPGVDGIHHIGEQGGAHEPLAQLVLLPFGQQRSGGVGVLPLPAAGPIQICQLAAAFQRLLTAGSAAHRAVDAAMLPRLQGDGPDKQVGKMTLSVAPQHRIHMVLNGIPQENIQLVVFDLPQLPVAVLPDQTVIFFGVPVLEQQNPLLLQQFHLRPGRRLPDLDLHLVGLGSLAEHQAVQLGLPFPAAGELQHHLAGSEGRFQLHPSKAWPRADRQFQLLAPGQSEQPRFGAGIEIPHHQTGGRQGLFQPQLVPHLVPFSVGDHLAEPAHAAFAAEALAHAVALDKALHRLLAPAQAVHGQAVPGPGHRKPKVFMVAGQRHRRPLGQGDVRPRHLKVGVGGAGQVQAGHPVQHQVLGLIGVVAALRPDQAGIGPRLGEGDIGIHPVLPFQLVADGIPGQVGSGVPHMVTAFKGHVGHVHPPPVVSRKHRQIKPHAVIFCGNMGNAAVLLGIRPPGGQRQVMGLEFCLHNRSFHWTKTKNTGAPGGRPPTEHTGIRPAAFKSAGPGRGSALDGADHHAFYKILLQEGIQAHHRQRSHNHCSIF